jgi:UPF0176 protein
MMTNQNRKPYRVLLYYKYVHIEDHEQFAAEHLQYCQDLGVKGRILVAEEGINGTISGTVQQTEQYMNDMHNDPRFSDMKFKIDEAEEHVFKRISVKPRSEIVSFKLEDDVDPNELTGERLSPQQFFEELQKDDVIVVDGRNDYEYDIGHFRGAVRPDVEAFRDFPQWIEENLSEHKDKRILTYCTGGIRCEKLSGYLKREGFEDVAQLEGGIVSYSKDPEVQGRLFDGKCYVFDERISVPINLTDEDVIVGKCYYCGKPEDRYVNCANPECNKQHICCPECEDKYKRSCSDECREHELNRYYASGPVC